MKKQIVFIHGGEGFTHYETFLNYLRTVDLGNPFDRTARKRWKDTLLDLLPETHDVLYPSMPNRQNAKYEEWKIWFERHFEFLRDGVILIGHSQGGYFLAKYLSENILPKKIDALYLVAAPFEAEEFDAEMDAHNEDGGDFAFDPENLKNVEAQVERIFVFHSKDDFVVPYAHSLKYETAFQNAELHTFEDRNHFLQEEFPELIESIKSL